MLNQLVEATDIPQAISGLQETPPTPGFAGALLAGAGALAAVIGQGGGYNALPPTTLPSATLPPAPPEPPGKQPDRPINPVLSLLRLISCSWI